MNRTLSKFRPNPEDEELEEVDQPYLMGFEMPQVGNEVREIEIRGERTIALSVNCAKNNLSHRQRTGVTVSNEQRTEVKNEHPRLQPMQDASEETHG